MLCRIMISLRNRRFSAASKPSLSSGAIISYFFSPLSSVSRVMPLQLLLTPRLGAVISVQDDFFLSCLEVRQKKTDKSSNYVGMARALV